jgi:hypothetical protein
MTVPEPKENNCEKKIKKQYTKKEIFDMLNKKQKELERMAWLIDYVFGTNKTTTTQ